VKVCHEVSSIVPEPTVVNIFFNFCSNCFDEMFDTEISTMLLNC